MGPSAEGIHVAAPDVRKNCICPNGGQPDANGFQVINPCCRVHYAERTAYIATPDYEPEIGESEIAEWQRREKKRVNYPKMRVAACAVAPAAKPPGTAGWAAAPHGARTQSERK